MPRTITKVAELKNKPDEFLECYDYGHSWARLGYFYWNSRNGVCRKFLCTRCMTIREDYFTRRNSKARWERLDYRYDYPDGYLKKGRGRVFKKDIHNEAIRRVMENNEILADDADLIIPDLIDH